MPSDFGPVFDALKGVFSKRLGKLALKADKPADYSVVSKSPSPFPQHKGQPMWFGQVKVGKAYVSFHLLPVYMNPVLSDAISPALRKRMQGKACFNFKTVPEPELLAELGRLVDAGIKDWRAKKWL